MSEVIENMLSKHRDHDEYIEKARTGQIPLGSGLGIDLDNHLRWKKGNFNIVLGHANVGKTFWVLWYLTALSVNHNLKHLVSSNENKVEELKIDIIELYNQKKIETLTQNELELSKK